MPALEVLLVDDPSGELERVQHMLEATGAVAKRATSIDEACRHLRTRAFDFILHSAKAGGLEPIVQLAHLTPIGLVGTDPKPPEVSFVVEPPVSQPSLLLAIEGCFDEQRLGLTGSIVRRYFTCLERATWDELAALCVEDVRYLAPDELGRRRVVEGRDAFVRFATETFSQFSRPRFSTESLRAAHGGAIVRYASSWLDPERRRIGMNGTMFVQFQDNQIQELDVRLDSGQLAHLIDEPPSNA